MNNRIAAISIATDESQSDQEVSALVNRLLALGRAKAEELLTQQMNATNPESPTYDPDAKVDEGLRALTSLDCLVEGGTYSANTLYFLGTGDAGQLRLRGARTSFDVAHDWAIMDSALELSQAVELRNVNFPERKLGGLLVRPATQGALQVLMQKALASLAGFGDIYTDAREKAGAVTAARNLSNLALRLTAENDVVCHGMLRADGTDIGEVGIRADGSLLMGKAEVPEDVLYVAVEAMGNNYMVSKYAGEAGDDEIFVIIHAADFYEDYISKLKL